MAKVNNESSKQRRHREPKSRLRCYRRTAAIDGRNAADNRNKREAAPRDVAHEDTKTEVKVARPLRDGSPNEEHRASKRERN
jgi:hypothetical protein